MVEWVVDNVRRLDPHGTVHVVTETTVGKTRGATETLHRALRAYPPAVGEPLVVANCDQLIAYDADWVRAGGTGHGIVFTFKSASSAHSYVETDKAGRITGIIEKPTYIRDEWKAVAGVYYFTNAAAITAALKDVLALRMDGEQYLSTALQWMIDQAYTLYAVDVPTAILGTPEDFQRFETALDILEWDGLRRD